MTGIAVCNSNMARQPNTLFLEEWLRNISGSSSNTISRISSSLPSSSSSSSARAIIQAWSDLRECLQSQRFQPHHLQSLKALLNSQATLHVAEPQAKLLLSILSSQNLHLPSESYPLLLRLLYIWIRKSFKPSLVLIDLAMKVLPNFFSSEFGKNSPFIYAECLLLLGAFSFAPSVPEKSKLVCLDLVCALLEEEYQLICSFEGIIPDVLAGIGYALSSSVDVHFVRILKSFFGIWGKENGPHASVSHGLMILHLIEWVVSGFIKSNYAKKIEVIAQEILDNPKANYIPFVLLMAAAGALRASSRSVSSGQGLLMLSRLRISAENQIASIAQDLISKAGGFPSSGNSLSNSLLLQCLSLALARSGPVSPRGPLFLCLASALLTETFPLRQLYSRVLEGLHDSSGRLRLNEVKEHLESVLFKEAGIIAGLLCNQYVSVDEENKGIVENLIWNYCQDIYLGHRQVALLLHGREDELLGNLEKIAESAFLMVVVFALAVTKYRLNSKLSQDSQMETSVQILISFSCVEYFRRMRLPEYMDTIRGVVVSIQENESACVSFVESMPSYADLTNCPDFPMEYLWSKDEVQTARILFYLRVIPTCIERVTAPVFKRVVAPTMFLYMEHPNEKAARAPHSVFAGFISSGKNSDQDERVSLKEQLAFYYIQRSLVGYPGITPFKGMASGVAALVRHLPAGNPATFYCIYSLVKKADGLCRGVFAHNDDMWKNWHGESDPCKEILELLLRLISLVDIQVLPNLMKLLAQLIVKLPNDRQNWVLNELHSLVAESDDVTRKPTLVSWLQSLSYLCSQATSAGATVAGAGVKKNSLSAQATDSLHLNARL